MNKNWDDDKELIEHNQEECPYCRQNYNPFQQMFGPRPPMGVPMNPQSGGPPTGPPPNKKPKKSSKDKAGLYAVDPGAIKPCTYRFVYLWLENGREFWAWLVYVGPTSVAGYRWTGYGWRYFGIDLKKIESFECF